MMDQKKQTKLSPAMVFNNQKKFSEKLHKRALQAIKGISEFYDKFEIKNDQDDTFLLNQLNRYYCELTHIIFNLQQILIDSGIPSISSANDLRKILTELNIITSSIQELLQMEPNKLKLKLKDIVVKVNFQFETLMKIIALDNSHEYKQIMLDCQLDFVISTEKLEMCQQLRHLSFTELMQNVHDINNDIKTICNQIKTGYENMEEDVSHYIRINIMAVHYIVNDMYQLRISGYFKGNLNAIFKQCEKIATQYLDDMENSVEYDNPIQKLSVFFENCHNLITMGASEFEKGVNENEHQNFNVKELIFYYYVHGLNALRSLRETIKDVMMKN